MQLKVGEIVEGKATRIERYGVFVDLGEGKTGMVHISEVARTYVNDIKDFVNIGDTVKVKILNIGEDEKIGLSMKRALEETRGGENGRGNDGPRHERRTVQPAKPDGSYVWMPRKSDSASFEDMMTRFKQSSDEKFSDLKRKNPEIRRSKRGAGVK